MKTVYDLLVQEIKALPIIQRERLFQEFGVSVTKAAIVVHNIHDYDLEKVKQEAMNKAFANESGFSMLYAVKYIKDVTGLGLKDSKELFEQTYKELAPIELRIKRSLDYNGWINTVSWLTENIYHDRSKAVEVVKESIKKYSYEFLLETISNPAINYPYRIESSSLRGALNLAKQRTGNKYKERSYGEMNVSPFDGLKRNFKKLEEKFSK